MKRTANCGELRKADAGKTVILNGWVHRKRDHGGISFINLRDRYGITQTVVEPDTEKIIGSGAFSALAAITEELRNEYCIALEGEVRARPGDMLNSEMPTGEIEVVVRRILILNRSGVLPFQIEEESKAGEELRLKYRYLDLRSFSMQRKIRLRSDVTFAVREWMTSQGFYEIETPTFIKSTPEGARDYLVPSRLYPGHFYALPQSPQLYKQILMVSGFDKYFQIARCYRDEDARGDRQPEFTQIDIEMSFVDREDILKMTESLLSHVFKKCLDVDLPAAFRRLTFEEAQELYGTDKPDLRFGMEMRDFAPFVERCGFQAFKDALASGEAEKQAAAERGVALPGGGVKALLVKGRAKNGETVSYSRKQIEELEEAAKIYRAKGMAWMKVTGLPGAPVLEGGISKFFADEAGSPANGKLANDIVTSMGAEPGDLILIVADSKRKIANTALGAVRSKLGRDLRLNAADAEGVTPGGGPRFEFCWIVDFPMFEFNEDENRWEAAHHMFTWPQERYHETMEQDPGSVKGDLYDLVLNGFELASGSIRIHDPELQKKVFRIVGFDPDEAEEKFGFLTEAFRYGAPPHGGIAPGLDRLVMLMAGENSIREVIAFPKNSFAQGLMDDSPSAVSDKQLKELSLQVKESQ
ncbi:MAG: aspartate--tRNA ligase [Treponema sp.]|nr:aspartate--tRNA ligase [Treponema sp.]